MFALTCESLKSYQNNENSIIFCDSALQSSNLGQRMTDKAQKHCNKETRGKYYVHSVADGVWGAKESLFPQKFISYSLPTFGMHCTIAWLNNISFAGSFVGNLRQKNFCIKRRIKRRRTELPRGNPRLSYTLQAWQHITNRYWRIVALNLKIPLT